MSHSFLAQSITSYGNQGIQGLSLYHYRNYCNLGLEISQGPIIIAGPNGAGKTNILEAISLFSTGRGLRGAKFSDITMDSSSQEGLQWGVSLQLHDGTQFATGLEKNSQGLEKRIHKVQGEIASSTSLFTEWFKIVWLTPETDRLFLEPPSLRRKFIDRLIFAEDPLHNGRLQRYEHALRERLTILRTTKDKIWLNALEEQLVNEGIAIAYSRQSLMEKLNHGQQYNHNLFPRFKSYMGGEIDQWVQNSSSTEVEELFREALFNNRCSDQETGTTKYGPHRSDWQVTYQSKNISGAQSSTGEQKILLIAVILSFISSECHSRNRLTILLLDDIIAHLDFHHRMVLFEQIFALHSQQSLKKNIQAWLTGTDPSLFESLIGKSQFLMVEHGTVTLG